MLLNISFTELSDLIKAKVNKDIQFRHVSNKTVGIGYAINIKVPIIGQINRTIEVKITINEIIGEDIHLIYDAGTSGDLLVKVIAPRINSIPAIDISQGSMVTIHLDKIDKLQEALKHVKFNDISFSEKGIVVDFLLKRI